MSGPAADLTRVLGRGPAFWGFLFVGSMFGVAALVMLGGIEGPAAKIMMVAPMVLLYPFIKATERRGAAKGCVNSTIVRYNRRILFASFGYVLGLGIAITLWRSYELSRPVVFAISLLPTLPTFAMIWAMGRYLVEETDEYLRHRTIITALHGLGLVLALGIFWGFLETFELVPHVWAWWVLPVWAIGMGLSQCWHKVTGR